MKYLAWHKVNKVGKKRSCILYCDLNFQSHHYNLRLFTALPVGEKSLKHQPKLQALLRVSLWIYLTYTAIQDTLTFTLRYRSAYFLFQFIKRAAKATTQRPQQPSHTQNAPHHFWKRSFHSHFPEKHFACKLFAAINASLWFHFREGKCLDQLQELMPQPCNTKVTWANINALITMFRFLPIAGDTWAGLVKLGDVDLPEHPWSVQLRKIN